MANGIAYEKLFPVVPLIGTAFAVCFDVGYFWGVGIDYFTLFSLTEHIGFALEAIPYALAISITGMFLVALVGMPFSDWPHAQKEVATNEQHLSMKKGILQFLKRRLRKLTWAVLFFVLFSIVARYLLAHERWRLTVLLLVVIMTTFTWLEAHKSWYRSGAIALLIIGCTVALLLGESIGSGYIAHTTIATADTLVLKSGDTVSANIIRSGERGILYAKPPSVIEFIQWDVIKSMSRAQTVEECVLCKWLQKPPRVIDTK